MLKKTVFFFKVMVTMVSMYWLLSFIDFATFLETLKNIHLSYLFFAIFLQVSVIILPSTRWWLTDVRDGVAHLSATATLGDGTESVLEMGPMTMRYVLTGELSTNMEIDPATGWTIRATTEGTFSGTMTMDMPGAGEMETPISMRSTMTIAPAGGS